MITQDRLAPVRERPRRLQHLVLLLWKKLIWGAHQGSVRKSACAQVVQKLPPRPDLKPGVIN
ncbi:MAG: hypothetical protein CL583_16945 [Alteromonadaceae bacterium]|uniref:Uncharacterized protein n=1 Tax=Hydrocarboniclastica marina TaxID=2259620 RepID=A0A4P7XMQ3_9ALTE|nr:hypothetical protein [Alteromonadaceae bacterium]QCF27437.1 hypothetical protein soil367_16735 [Hydrocarboniclastica marina]